MGDELLLNTRGGPEGRLRGWLHNHFKKKARGGGQAREGSRYRGRRSSSGRIPAAAAADWHTFWRLRQGSSMPAC